MAQNWAYVGCADFATGSGPTGSVQYHGRGTAVTGSYNFVYHTASLGELADSTLVLTGTLVVTGTISASHYHIKDVTTIDGTGSTKFGDSLDDTHIRTGSLLVTSSYTNPTSFMTHRVGIGTLNPSGTFHIQTGEAGVAPDANYDDLVVAGAGATGISVLNPDNQYAYYVLGHPSDPATSMWWEKYDNAYTSFGATSVGRELRLVSGNGTVTLTLDANQNVTASQNLIVTDAILVDPNAGASELSAGVISASAGITGSAFLTDGAISAGFISASAEVSASAYYGDGSTLSGIAAFPFTGNATIIGSLSASAGITGSTFLADGHSSFHKGITLKNGAASAGYINFYEADGATQGSVCTFRAQSQMGNITITLPGSTGTVVLEDNTVTLSNKTLTNPTIDGTITGGTSYSGSAGITGSAFLTDGAMTAGLISASAEVSASNFYGSGMGLSPVPAGTTNPYRILTSDGSGNGRLGDNSSDAMITATHFRMGMSGTPTFVSAFTGSVVISGTYGVGGAPSQTLLDVYGVNSDSILFVTGSNRVGINTSDPDHELAVLGNVSASLNISASAFYGDGSTLSGVYGFPFIGDAAITGSLVITGSDSSTLLTLKTDSISDVLVISDTLLSSSLSSSALVVVGDRLQMGNGSKTAADTFSSVAGGHQNQTNWQSKWAFIGGGYSNALSGAASFSTNYTTIGGGQTNTIGQGSDNATIGGGEDNTIISSQHATIAGGSANIIDTVSHTTIGGGADNHVRGQYGFVGGGVNNVASQAKSTVVGGQANTASNFHGFVGAGQGNNNAGRWAAIAGGWYNGITQNYAFIGAGEYNQVTARDASVVGGTHNTASADRSVVLGSSGSTVSGKDSFAIGSDLTIAEARRAVLGSSVAGYVVILSGSTNVHGNLTIVDDDLTVSGSTRLSGSFSAGYRRVTANYEVKDHLAYNYILGVSASLTTKVNIVLPSASVGRGHTLIIKDEFAGYGGAARTEQYAITASVSSSTNLVEGNSAYYVYGSMGSITLYSDGVNKWFVV